VRSKIAAPFAWASCGRCPVSGFGLLDRHPLDRVALVGVGGVGVEVRPAADDERLRLAAEGGQVTGLPRLAAREEAVEAGVAAVLVS
jgi:hypothetical protein